MINKKTKPKINTSLWVNEWMNTHRNVKRECPTVGEAMQSYIDNHSNIWCSALLHHSCHLKHQLKFMSNIYIDEVDSTMLQSLINFFAQVLTTHEIHQRINFICMSLEHAGIDEDYKLTFPANYRVRNIERS